MPIFRSIIKKDINKIEGFTLAEVLVTLMIIGIVAAMTVPGLTNYFNDMELKTNWIKTYAAVSQATDRMKVDNGGNMDNFGYVFCSGDWANDQKVMKAVQTYYNSNGNIYYTNNGDCGMAANTLRQMYNTTYSNAETNLIRYGNGSYVNFINNSWNGFILNNGVFLFYGADGASSCNGTAHKTLGKNCFPIWVDVNGVKQPNMWGKDIFYIWVAENGAYPYGVNPSTLKLDVCDKNNSINCGAWILQNSNYNIPF